MTLGTRDDPLPVGPAAAKRNPERDRMTAEIVDELRPILAAQVQRYDATAVAQALASYLGTMLVRGLGPEGAAALLRGMADQTRTMAALDAARRENGGTA